MHCTTEMYPDFAEFNVAINNEYITLEFSRFHITMDMHEFALFRHIMNNVNLPINFCEDDDERSH